MKNQNDFNKHFVITISQNSTIEESLLNEIKPGRKLSAKRALEVYQEDYQARLTEALKNTYKAIHLILGDADFYQLAKFYIEAYRSTSSNLDDYGDELSLFIFSKKLYEEFPFLSKLADYEWKLRLAFHFKSMNGLNANELQLALSHEANVIQLSPFVFIINSQYSLSDLYQYAFIEDHQESSESMTFDHSQYLLMFKGQTNVQILSLTKNQWNWTKKLQQPIDVKTLFAQSDQNISAEELKILFQYFANERLLIKPS